MVGRRVATKVVVSERRKLAALGDDLAGGGVSVFRCFQDVNLGCAAALRDNRSGMIRAWARAGAEDRESLDECAIQE